jgi:ABC-2 type transport system ATP-binding protein
MPMIAARGLEMRFGRVEALKGLDLEIEHGELFALIGPDGAGKSTFFRLVAGLLKPTAGTITTPGVRSFGLVPQRFSLYEDLSIDENLTLRARLYSVPNDVAERRATELLARVGLDRFRARLAGALSGGMKQKLSLVAALLTEPELLLLDEPTTGVDPVSRREFWLLLNRLHHDGLTILVSTPYMDEAEYATRIGFLDEGRLVALGTRGDILASYSRALTEVRTVERLSVRGRLTGVTGVDDVSLFGTRLHVRGREGVGGDQLILAVRAALDGLVPADDVTIIEPSIEDVFVLSSEGVAS